MKFTIAQIGKNRLKKVLVDDREQDPEKLCDVLKSDFLRISKCYMEQPEIFVEVKESDDEILFNITLKTRRVKSIGVLSF